MLPLLSREPLILVHARSINAKNVVTCAVRMSDPPSGEIFTHTISFHTDPSFYDTAILSQSQQYLIAAREKNCGQPRRINTISFALRLDADQITF